MVWAVLRHLSIAQCLLSTDCPGHRRQLQFGLSLCWQTLLRLPRFWLHNQMRPATWNDLCSSWCRKHQTCQSIRTPLRSHSEGQRLLALLRLLFWWQQKARGVVKQHASVDLSRHTSTWGTSQHGVGKLTKIRCMLLFRREATRSNSESIPMNEKWESARVAWEKNCQCSRGGRSFIRYVIFSSERCRAIVEARDSKALPRWQCGVDNDCATFICKRDLAMQPLAWVFATFRLRRGSLPPFSRNRKRYPDGSRSSAHGRTETAQCLFASLDVLFARLRIDSTAGLIRIERVMIFVPRLGRNLRRLLGAVQTKDLLSLSGHTGFSARWWRTQVIAQASSSARWCVRNCCLRKENVSWCVERQCSLWRRWCWGQGTGREFFLNFEIQQKRQRQSVSDKRNVGTKVAVHLSFFRLMQKYFLPAVNPVWQANIADFVVFLKRYDQVTRSRTLDEAVWTCQKNSRLSCF